MIKGVLKYESCREFQWKGFRLRDSIERYKNGELRSTKEATVSDHYGMGEGGVGETEGESFGRGIGQGLFNQNGIKVITGVPVGSPGSLVKQYLSDPLVTGDNICDH